MTTKFCVEYVDLSKAEYDQEQNVMANDPTHAAQIIVDKVNGIDCGQTIAVTNLRTNEISFFILNDAFELVPDQD